jgi:PhnB protein
MKKFILPDNYQTVMPYLIVDNATGFKQFMQDVFEAKELQTFMKKGEPGIMHGEVQIGGSTIMYADSTPQWSSQTGGLYINVADADATYQLALAKGATAITPLSDQPYGRSGGVKDPFGNVWWITTPN